MAMTERKRKILEMYDRLEFNEGYIGFPPYPAEAVASYLEIEDVRNVRRTLKTMVRDGLLEVEVYDGVRIQNLYGNHVEHPHKTQGYWRVSSKVEDKNWLKDLKEYRRTPKYKEEREKYVNGVLDRFKRG